MYWFQPSPLYVVEYGGGTLSEVYLSRRYTVSGAQSPFCPSRRAANPATCGAAIDVPCLELYPPPKSVLMIWGYGTPVPGATTSICGPKFENQAWASYLSTAPTAIHSSYAAG